MSSRTVPVMVCSAVLAGLAVGEVRAQVFFAQSTLRTMAGDGTGTTSGNDNVGAVPWFHVREVNHGPSTAITTYHFRTEGDELILETSFDHARNGSSGNLARSFGFFTFQPFEDLAYTLEGDYASTGGGLTSLTVDLRLGGASLFHNVQTSNSAGAHAFVLGGQDGDQSNVLSGSLTGVLFSGNDYSLDHWYEIVESAGAASASATGFVRLRLAPVSEPTGACCLPDGSCEELTEDDCLAADGTYQGDGTDCETAECPQPHHVGDFDGDGDVDMDDFAVLQRCLAALAAPGCDIADLNGDGEIDETDVDIFLGCLSGPNIPFNPDCAE